MVDFYLILEVLNVFEIPTDINIIHMLLPYSTLIPQLEHQQVCKISTPACIHMYILHTYYKLLPTCRHTLHMLWGALTSPGEMPHMQVGMCRLIASRNLDLPMVRALAPEGQKLGIEWVRVPLNPHPSDISAMTWVVYTLCIVCFYFVVDLCHSNSISVISWRWYDVWDEKEKAWAYIFTDSRDL